MTRNTLSFRILLLSAVGGALSACGPVNRGLESINQPVVSRTDYVFDVAVPEYGALSGPEAARLDAWFRSMELRYGDTVYLDDPQGGGDPVRRAGIASVAARYGLLVTSGSPVTQGQVPQGSMRVIVSRTAAFVPDCPNWDRTVQTDFNNNTSSNYGCSVNANFAAMIANPEDLIRGRVAGTADAATVTKAVNAYRSTTPTGGGALKSLSSKGN